MKKQIKMRTITCIIIACICINVNAQTTYICNPSSGVYTNAISDTIQGNGCSYKYYGDNMIKLRVDITGNKFVFMVSKVAANSTFSDNTEVYIKESSVNDYPMLVCSNIYFPCIGTNTLKYYQYDASSFISGTKYFCATTYNSSSNRYYSCKIAITATNSTPSTNYNISLSGCMGFSPVLQLNSSTNFTAKISNTGNAPWTGFIILKLDGKDWDISAQTVPAKGELNLSRTITPTFIGSTASLYYQTNGANGAINGTLLSSNNNCQNPKTLFFAKKVDGFDYPIGSRGYEDGFPSELLEGISPEKNDICSSNTSKLPNRSTTGTGWYVRSDCRNFVSKSNPPSHAGLHPAEDWNNSVKDIGQPVYCIANGVVKEIKTVNGDGTNSNGWAIKIEHTLPDNTHVYSYYFHVTSANSESGVISSNGSDFTISVGQYLKRGEQIAKISTVGHLHLELRDKYIANIYPNGQSNGYYTNSKNSSWDSYTDSKQIPRSDIESALALMKIDGIQDPSDYIDAHRPYKINDGLEIYAGCINNPKPFKVWFVDGNISSSYSVSDVYIGSKKINPVISYLPISSDGISSFNISLSAQDLSTLTDGSNYNFSFIVNSTDTFKGKNQIYFLNAASIVNKLVKNNQYADNINDIIGLGLMKGNTNGNFSPSIALTRGQAAKAIVRAAVLLYEEANITKMGDRSINISTDQYGSFSDVTGSAYNDYYLYIQTLRNWGCIPRTDLFRPYDKISIGDLCDIICSVFKISFEQTNINSTASSIFKNIISDYPNIVTLTQIIINDGTIPHRIITNFGKGTDMIFKDGNLVIKSGDTIQRQIFTKLLSNVFHFVKQDGYVKYTCSLLGGADISSISNVSNLNFIGEMYEIEKVSETGFNFPILEKTYTIKSNHDTIFGSNQPDNRNYFFWVANNGKIEDITHHPSHYQIKFTAPLVTTETIVKLYVFVGNLTGQGAQGIITIRVIPETGTPSIQTPNQQVKNITIHNVTDNNATINWNKGDGNYSALLIREGAPVDAYPTDGSTYSINTDISLASQIGKNGTKVMFSNYQSSTVNISGLKSGTIYYLTVVSQNGDNNATKYLTSNIQNVSFLTSNSSLPILKINTNGYLETTVKNKQILNVAPGTNLSFKYQLPMQADSAYWTITSNISESLIKPVVNNEVKNFPFFSGSCNLDILIPNGLKSGEFIISIYNNDKTNSCLTFILVIDSFRTQYLSSRYTSIFGNNGDFKTLIAQAPITSNISYLWQINDNNGWRDTSVFTKNFYILKIDSSILNYRYRCVVRNDSCLGCLDTIHFTANIVNNGYYYVCQVSNYEKYGLLFFSLTGDSVNLIVNNESINKLVNHSYSKRWNIFSVFPFYNFFIEKSKFSYTMFDKNTLLIRDTIELKPVIQILINKYDTVFLNSKLYIDSHKIENTIQVDFKNGGCNEWLIDPPFGSDYIQIFGGLEKSKSFYWYWTNCNDEIDIELSLIEGINYDFEVYIDTNQIGSINKNNSSINFKMNRNSKILIKKVNSQ